MGSETQNHQSSPTHESYWRFTKRDFFPEESFKSFSSYIAAFSQTGRRFKDRFLNRSTDETELITLQKESLNEFKKCLTWWDLTWLSFGAVVGSGIFAITGQEARYHAGPAIVVSYALSGLSALLSAFCYTEFAVEVPVAGGSFSYLRIELGDFVAFIAAGNILLEAVVGAAGLGRAWSSYFASLIKSDADFLRFRANGLAEGFNMLDPVAVLVLLVANSIAASGTRNTSVLNWVSSVVTSLVILLVIIITFTYGKTSNLSPFFPYGADGVFKAAAVVYWSYTGFDMVATMAEETKNPSRDIPIGLVGSMSAITVVYCLMALGLTMMQKYTEIDPDAAYSIVFGKFGITWAKYVVSVIALKGMTTSLLVGALGQARYITQIARSHMIPPYFARIHPKTKTPINATLLLTIISVVFAFFTSLDVLSSVFSVSTLVVFMLMAVSLLVRRYYVKDSTSKNDVIKFLVCLAAIFGSSVAITLVWSLGSRSWIGCLVAGVFWFLGTLGMALLPQRHTPIVWGVPLVPWMPALSIGMNLFLIGSLGYKAIWRFFICTIVMLVYYVVVGVHATYDVAHQIQEEPKVERVNEANNNARSQHVDR
ncbi:Cationic amino acid transporter, C-terminal [Dillenia turbinata]|uniref:Cationic amino acid transporter, C-terminal n=1 Tax=Dillenia turbinata TaxID=194707 RepID=A0AAN8Z6D5_9MAGN